MAKISILAGSTSKLIDIFVQDSSSTTGSGLTGLVFNTASLTAYYYREGAASATAITLATMTLGTWATSGFVVVDGTNMPGAYQLGIPNAAIAAGAKSVLVMLKGATNMAPVVIELELTLVDNQDAVRGGMTALPNAAAAAANGLPVLGTNATAISFTAGMTISNATGSGLTLSSGGSNGSGLATSGNGSGHGILTTGGATGHGMSAVGGATSGDGISAAAATSGHGLTATGVGTTKHGLNATGGGTTSHGISAVGGGVGHGILAQSGAGATGDGLRATAASTNGNGFNTLGVGTGAGHLSTGGATGHGMSAVGGATSGDGISAAAATSGHGLTATGVGTTKHGVNATGGSTTSHGISATGGGVGHGILATSGGGATGDGIRGTAASTNGNGVNGIGVGTGAGLLATGGATGAGISGVGGATSGSGVKATGTAGNAIGLQLVGQGSAAGINATGGATGHGVAVVGGATSGDGVNVTTTSGHGINLAPVGTSKHGLFATGGNGGTSDGISAVAGTGGVPIRGDLTANITGNLSGSVGSVTGAVGSVTGAVGSVTGNVGGNVVGSTASVTGNVGGNVTGSVGSVATGGITSASFAASAINAAAIATDAITAAKIAADAIGASELAADAVTEIQSGLATAAALATVQADTDDIQTRLPAALVGGRMDSSVGAVAAGAITAAAIADGAIDRATFAADTGLVTIRSNTAQAGAAGTITLDASASAVDDFYNDTRVLLTGGTGVGQVRHIRDYVGATKVATVVPSWATNPDNTSTFAVLAVTSAWDETLADHLDSGSTGASLNAAGSAGDPWSTALPGAYGSGSAGNIVGNRLDAAVTSRLAPTTAARTLDVSAAGNAGIDWANIDAPTTPQDLAGTKISNLGKVYYVTTAGNDTTGDGSQAAPWLTISKALLTVASGDTVLIGDGTYDESTSGAGYLNISRTFTDWVTFESLSGVPAAVIIRGASDASLNTSTGAANAYFRFRNLTFGARLSTNVSCLRLIRTDRMELINCYATAPSDTGASRFALHLATSASVSIANLTVDGGIWSGNGNTNAHGIFAVIAAGSDSLVNPIFRNVSADGILSALTLSGIVTNFLVEGGIYASAGTYGIRVGQDSATSAGTLSGTLRAFTIDHTGSSGDGLLIGAGATAVTVERDFVVRAGNYGILIRDTSGATIKDGTVRAGQHLSAASGSAIYARGATGCSILRCRLEKKNGINGCIQVGVGAAASGTITCVDNTIVSFGGLTLEWGSAGASGDSGGSVNDRNVYDLRGAAATIGSVYGTTGITTMGGLRTAWGAYDVTTNDAKSSMAPPTAEYYTPTRAAALDTLGRVLYVRTTGNDTTGDGSNSSPYLTISKAQAVAADGDTIRIGNGTYDENTSAQGYFQINRTFLRFVIFESESGDPATVIIRGATHANFNTLTSGAVAYYRFKDLTFGVRTSTMTSALRVSRADHIEFINCRATAPTDVASPTKFGFHIATSGSGVAINHLLLDSCIVTGGANSNAHGCFVTGQDSVGSTLTDVRFVDCQMTGVLSALTITDDVAEILVDGGIYNGTGSYGIRVGQDSQTPLGTQTGTVKNAIITTEYGTGHGLLIGAGTSGVVVENNDVRGADYSIVIKECSNAIVRGNQSRGGLISAVNGAALYFKAAVGTVAERNTLISYSGTVGTVRLGVGDTGNKSGTVALRENLIVGYGVKALNWADSTGDSGGGVVDQNTYSLFGAATLGDVRGTTAIANMTALRAAWDSYSVTTNDERSEMLIDHTPYGADPSTVADAVWDEVIAGHLTAGSTGNALAAAGGGGSVLTPADIWGYSSRTLTSYGTLAADTAAAVWSYATRTLTQTVASIISSITGSGTIAARRADTAVINITGLGSLTGRTKLWFTVKESINDPDSAAILQIEETAGLLRVNGAAAASAGAGSLVVTNATTGALTITVAASVMASLELQDRLWYDIKKIVSGVVSASEPARFGVSDNVTQSVS